MEAYHKYVFDPTQTDFNLRCLERVKMNSENVQKYALLSSLLLPLWRALTKQNLEHKKKKRSKTVQTIFHNCGAVWPLLALNKNLPSNRAGEKQCNILAFEFSQFVKENVLHWWKSATKIEFYQMKVEYNHDERFRKVTFRALALSQSKLESICSDEGQMLETSAFYIFHGGNSAFINLFDKTKFLEPGFENMAPLFL